MSFFTFISFVYVCDIFTLKFLLIVPRTRRRIGDRAFSVAASQASNRLPTEQKLLRLTDSFRRDLKTFLFHSVFGHQDTD